MIPQVAVGFALFPEDFIVQVEHCAKSLLFFALVLFLCLFLPGASDSFGVGLEGRRCPGGNHTMSLFLNDYWQWVVQNFEQIKQTQDFAAMGAQLLMVCVLLLCRFFVFSWCGVK